MTMLSKNGYVDASHGKGGGYKLNRKPEEYKVGDILRLTEGTLAPVACLEKMLKNVLEKMNAALLVFGQNSMTL